MDAETIVRQLGFASSSRIEAYISAQTPWHYRGISLGDCQLRPGALVLLRVHCRSQRDARSLQRFVRVTACLTANDERLTGTFDYHILQNIQIVLQAGSFQGQPRSVSLDCSS